MHRKWIRIPEDPIKFFNYCIEESKEIPFSVFSRVCPIKTLEKLLNSEINENTKEFNRLNKAFPGCFKLNKNPKKNIKDLLNAPWILWKKKRPSDALEYAVERWDLQSHLVSDAAIALRKIFPKNTEDVKELLKKMRSEAFILWKNRFGIKKQLNLSSLGFQPLPSEIARLPIKFLNLSNTKVGPLPDSFKSKNWTIDIRNTPLSKFLKYKKEKKEKKGYSLKRERAIPAINRWTLIIEDTFKGSPLKKRLKKTPIVRNFPFSRNRYALRDRFSKDLCNLVFFGGII